MELYEAIRRDRRREELSIRELARRHGVHRRAVREALASPVPPSRKPRPAMPGVLAPWVATVDGWLLADREVPRKQRHTARRIWQRLVSEHGVACSESTVTRLVRARRRELGLAGVEVMVPQAHEPGGEAEVDFGEFSALIAGVVTRCQLFGMRLSASGKAVHVAYTGQSQEAFFDGHVRAFEVFGGVPARVRYDNLRPAVVRILRGRDRVESDRFVTLRSHYGFDSFFCRPGRLGAHEKGGIEGEIGRFRRWHLTPVPNVASLAELNGLIAAADAADDERRIDGRPQCVGADFAVEQPRLLPLPGEPFDCASLLVARVDSKARVTVRQARYSVPLRYVGRRLTVRLSASTVEVLDGATVVAGHARATTKFTDHLVLDHYLEVLKVKPGALPGATALAQARAGGAFAEAHQRFWDLARRRLGDAAGTRALVEVLLAHRQLPAPALLGALEAAVRDDCVDPQLVVISARRAAGEKVAEVAPIGALTRFDRPTPALGRYDCLLSGRRSR